VLVIMIMKWKEFLCFTLSSTCKRLLFSFRILVRAISYTVHGLIPASCVFADRYNREEVVRSLGKEINLNPPLTLGQLPDTPEELLKLDQVIFYVRFIKSKFFLFITTGLAHLGRQMAKRKRESERNVEKMWRKSRPGKNVRTFF